ncbi:MAG: hypothetical protein IJ229_08795 [Clostridia bacterium]|nr:hypothetical protein [Clostridia bacterium]MBR1683900.1 hypothetical protein [Clostridia bacterium]MBR2288739.1 hypothetical protein [Clostridia bacterium]
MRKKSNISLGPGASSLILIFVVLSLMTLGMLSLMTGKNDLTLSGRSADVVEAVYALNVQAEETRSRIDRVLVESAKDATDQEAYLEAVALGLEDLGEEIYLEDDLVCFTVSDGYREIDCALKVASLGDSRRASWERYNLYAVTEDVWN